MIQTKRRERGIITLSSFDEGSEQLTSYFLRVLARTPSTRLDLDRSSRSRFQCSWWIVLARMARYSRPG